jgi:hypothetical protein
MSLQCHKKLNKKLNSAMDVTVYRKLGCNRTPTDRKGKEVDGSLLKLDRVLVGNRSGRLSPLSVDSQRFLMRQESHGRCLRQTLSTSIILLIKALSLFRPPCPSSPSNMKLDSNHAKLRTQQLVHSLSSLQGFYADASWKLIHKDFCSIIFLNRKRSGVVKSMEAWNCPRCRVGD